MPSFAWIFANTAGGARLASAIFRSSTMLTANGKVDVLFVDEKALTIELPSSVSLKITESPGGVKGYTASNVQKPGQYMS